MTAPDISHLSMSPSWGTPILFGVLGSRAYGLHRPDSDWDMGGVFMAPLSKVLGLDGPGAVQETFDLHDPDIKLHEVGKFCGLVLKGNPTVSEMLWLPSYEFITDAGKVLVGLRRHFLGQKAIRAAYTGYAIQQARRLVDRNKEGRKGFDPDLALRTAKHGRHCHRLLLQADGLLRTGVLTVNVSEHRDEIFASGELAEKDPVGFQELFQQKVAEIDAIESDLPQEGNRALVNAALVTLRAEAKYDHGVRVLRYLVCERYHADGATSREADAILDELNGED